MKKGIALSVLLVAAMLFSAQAFAVTVSGTVIDTNAKPVEGATVMFTDDNDASNVFSVITDIYGEYELEITTTAVDEKLMPEAVVLGQNFPNPFNPTTVIPFTVAQAGIVELNIYNSLGQKIRTLVNDQYQPGSFSVSWNGLDDNGMNVAAGIYIYRLRSAGNVQAKKMLLIDGGSHAQASAVTGGGSSPAFSAAKKAATTWTVTITGEDIMTTIMEDVVIEDNLVLSIIVPRVGYSVSGTVVDGDGNALEGVNVEMMNNGSYYYTSTDASGNYVFEGYPNGTYSVSVSLNSYEFLPIYNAAEIDGANVTDIDFTGTFIQTMTLTGRVVDTNGDGVEGVKMVLASLSHLYEAVTDADGYYTMGTALEETLLLTPQADGLFFTPENMTVYCTDLVTTVDNFVASTEIDLFQITGFIVDADGDPLYTMVHLYEGNSRIETTTNDMTTGMYTFNNLRNGTYTIKVDEFGAYTFTNTEVIVNGNDVIVNDIVGDDGSGGQKFTISGKCVDGSGNGVEGVTLTTTTPDGIKHATSDANGDFVFEDMSNGRYFITAYKEGLTFNPGLQTVTVDNANVVIEDSYVALSAE